MAKEKKPSIYKKGKKSVKADGKKSKPRLDRKSRKEPTNGGYKSGGKT